MNITDGNVPPGTEIKFTNKPPKPPNALQSVTLRDYFAAAALQGLLAAPEEGGANPHVTTWHFHEFAQASYMCADAMMLERDKP